MSSTARERRPYESPRRRQQVAETRERIITAGCELLHRSSIRDWRGITIRAVARAAGIHERTVYRYFANERELRDGVMNRLEQEAGIDLAGMDLSDIAEVAARILAQVSSYPREARSPLDPTLNEANRRQHQALYEATEEGAGGWSPSEVTSAAAMFDVLWSVATYERLIVDWEMDHERAVGTITWVISLLQAAVRQDRRPIV
jgi:AcrR family transcriptional regulator